MKDLIIENKEGSELTFTRYGACLKSWNIQLPNEKIIDITLGYKDNHLYKKNPLYLGSTIGRYANRIAKGKFILNGKIINLQKNDGSNHLHGGEKGLSFKAWDVLDKSEDTLVFKTESIELEGNYPGTVNVKVKYHINNSNELIINYYAKSTEDTIINLTNHSYFNLNGNSNCDILNHKIKIKSNQITEVNQDLIPTGKFIDVKNTPFDFSCFKKIGDNISSNHNQISYAGGYDHNFILENKKSDLSKKVVELIGDKSKIKMYIKTNLPGIQFYTGNFLDGSYQGKNGYNLLKNFGLCLEPQFYPDSPNHAHFPSTILKKGTEYNKCIIYGLTI